jgi:hypothetical protein
MACGTIPAYLELAPEKNIGRNTMRLPNASATILMVAAVAIIFAGAMGTGTLAYGRSQSSMVPPAEVQGAPHSRAA